MMTKKIFLADDDIDDIELFQEALADVCTSCSLVSSKNGEELLAKLTDPSGTPYVLFLDVNMPIMNGLECLEKIRAVDSLKNIPVIILTTSTSPTTIERAYKLGANLFAVKPSDFSQLKKLIMQIMQMDFSQFMPRSRQFVLKVA